MDRSAQDGTPPGDAAAWRARGDALYDDGEDARAAEAYREAIALDPGDAAAHGGVTALDA